MKSSQATKDQALWNKILPKGSLRVLQITDTHLYADPDQCLLGVNTLASFQSVIEEIQSIGWPIDVVLATGDLVHDASMKGYKQLTALLNQFNLPVYCLPGNHDVPASMSKYLQSSLVSCPKLVEEDYWQIILLDSVKPAEEGGHIAEAELNFLEESLSSTRKPTLVTLHHQPIPVGSEWIDNMTIDNAEEFLSIIDKHPHVKVVLWGHVHQDFESMRAETRYIASPSTCVQFLPHEDTFNVDTQAPGFRLLALLPDGKIETQVVRTALVPKNLDASSPGY